MNNYLEKFDPVRLIKEFEKAIFGFVGCRPCKILHLVTGNLFGGVETTLINMCQLKQAVPDLDQSFAVMFPGRLRRELESFGAPILDVGPVRMRYPWQVLRARRLLRDHLRVRPVDLVISHSCWTHSIYSGVARSSKISEALWLHDKPKGRGNGRSCMEYLASHSPPDFLITNSHYTASGAKHLYPRMEPKVVYPITNMDLKANDSTVRLKIRKELGCPENRRVALITSRFDPFKGHQNLINALGIIGLEGDWECWLANEPQTSSEICFKNDLELAAARLGISKRLRWLGHRRDVFDLYKAADVFCQPNQGPEPFGQVFIEAQAAKCPVITYKLGGAIEALFPGEPNVLLEPGDQAGLVEALRRFLVGKVTGNI